MITRLRFHSLFAFCAVVSLAAGTVPSAQSGRPRSGNPDARTVLHVLNRLGFGPTGTAVEQVRRTGIAAYIDSQLHPDRIPDAAMAARLAPFTTLSKTSGQLAREYFLPAMLERRERQRRSSQPATDDAPAGPTRPDPASRSMQAPRAPLSELFQQKVLRAAYGERQLEEVLVDFWFNHFNVFAGKGQVRTYLTEYERDTIRPHVLGRFRDLLGATAKSPAMLFYLDNWQSAADANARTSSDRTSSNDDSGRRQPRTGRPRVQPMPGAPRRERTAPGLPARRRGLNENYARELMELHTLGVDGGYTQQDVQEIARAFTGWTIANPRQGGPFRFDPRLHDDGVKIVLGQRIPAGGGQRDGEIVLDILARHPSTARFIATKLSRRFVADDPPPALVARAAQRFSQTSGDIREVVRTILTSPEFLAPQAYAAKTKNPFEFVVSAVRAMGVDFDTALPLVQAVRELGMPLYGAQPPTGYADLAEAWVSTGALLDRMNFAVSLASGRLLGMPSAGRGLDDARAASAALAATALGGELSDATAATVARAGTGSQASALILGSPEFQKK